MSRVNTRAATCFKIDEITFEVVRKRMKNLVLRIHPSSGTVRISAPLRISFDQVQAFARHHLPWILRQKDRLAATPQVQKSKFIDHEIHSLWGKPYSLRIHELEAGSHSKKQSVEVIETEISMRVVAGASAEARAALLERLYQERLSVVASALIQKWEPLMQVKSSGLDVRRMKTRWGSCHTGTRQIRLNSELARVRIELTQYVVVHELTHLLEPSHNARFKAFMDQFLPNWRQLKNELNANCPL